MQAILMTSLFFLFYVMEKYGTLRQLNIPQLGLLLFMKKEKQ